MDLALRIDNNIVAIIASIIFLIYISKRIDQNDPKIRVFVLMFTLNTIQLITETLTCIINRQPYIWLIPITEFLHVILFILGPLITYLWFLFAYLWVNGNRRINRRYNLMILSPMIINALAVLASPFLKLVFDISANNVYQRGFLFFLPAMIAYFYLLLGFIFIYINREKTSKVEFLPLLLFAVFPVTGGIIQSLFYGFLLIWSSIAFSLIFIYLYLQQQMIQIDHLTGAWTRDTFYSFLNNRIKQNNSQRFAIVFLDMDNFKKINDTFGHLEGDKALTTVVQIINHLLRKGDFIARYGGDEFVLYLNAESKGEIEALLSRISQALDNYNRTKKHPYELGFSYGYKLYDFDTHMSIDEYIKYVDELMYKAKLRKKQG